MTLSTDLTNRRSLHRAIDHGGHDLETLHSLLLFEDLLLAAFHPHPVLLFFEEIDRFRQSGGTVVVHEGKQIGDDTLIKILLWEDADILVLKRSAQLVHTLRDC